MSLFTGSKKGVFVCAAGVALALGLSACGSSQDGNVAKAAQVASTGVPETLTEAPVVIPSDSKYKLSPDLQPSVEQVWQSLANNPLVSTSGMIFDGIGLTDIRKIANTEVNGATGDRFSGRYGNCIGNIVVVTWTTPDEFHAAGQKEFQMTLFGPFVLKDGSTLGNMVVGNLATDHFTAGEEGNAFLAANRYLCFD